MLLAAIVVASSFWTEMQWYNQIDAARVFWTQYRASIILGLIGTLLVAAVVIINYMVARAGRKTEKGHIAVVEGEAAGSESFKEVLESKKWLTYLVIPLVVGVFAGSGLNDKWRTFMLWLNGGSFGQTDPEYGLDVSFYVFTLPVLHVILSFVVTLLVVSVVTAVATYWIYGDIQTPEKGGIKLSKRLQAHVGILLAVAGLVVAGNYFLGRYDLLLGNNQKFSGASFTDINASKPGLTIMAMAAAAVAILFLWAAVRRQWKPAIIGIATTAVAGIVVSGIYPALMQSFKVNPNAAELESTYIARNIDATLKAYGMDEVETTSYAARTDAEPGQLRQDSETAAQIRLLDPTIVDPSFNQLQQNRQYYQFLDNLSVDRYSIDGEMRDTVIAVRELNLNGLDNERRSWVNDHTVYTHGFGVAAAFGNTANAKGDPAFWESGIPSSGELGDYEPRVYFGQASPSYSIVGAPEGSEPWELDYPDDKAPNGQVMNTYTGDGGPKVSNAFAKLMYSIKFKSTEMFFSDRVTSESQILWDRDPHTRVEKVAPYLTLDSKAYPVVVDMDGNPDTPKELVWMIDGYTTSNNYPYSARETLTTATADARNRSGLTVNAPDEINYIRNSVKAIVNAYDGSVTLYQWDQEDPIINAWKGIFPDQITPLSEMPGDLIAHVRYPEDLFKVQRQLMARYHVTDAKSFYSGGDFWQVPREPTMAASELTPAQPPYYLTIQMPGTDKASFSLTTSYIPGGNTNRNVMTGFLAVDSNAGNEKGKIADSYGKLRMLELPRDLTIEGPGQAENTMLTNPQVSSALNLLRQGGTQVLSGNLLSLPIGDGMLYVQPMYIQASSGTQYPTLQYVLTMFGGNVGFAPTLSESLDKVFGGNAGVETGDSGLAGVKEDPVPGTDPTDTPTDTPTDGPTPTETPSATSTPSSTATSGVTTPGTPQERLNKALADAKKALEDSIAAQKAGDWSKYGEAQERLQKAVEEAAKAETEL